MFNPYKTQEYMINYFFHIFIYMKKNKTYKYKPSKNNKSKRKNNKSKRKQGGSPKTEKNILVPTGPYTGYLGEVLQEKQTIPQGVGRMTYYLPNNGNGIYADYLGKWEDGKKHDNAGRYIVNVRNNDMYLPKYYLQGKWKDNKKEGFHDVYPIGNKYNEYNPYNLDKINNKKPAKTLYFEDDKPADKKIEDTIKETLDNKNIPDEIIRNINSYRQR